MKWSLFHVRLSNSKWQRFQTFFLHPSIRHMSNPSFILQLLCICTITSLAILLCSRMKSVCITAKFGCSFTRPSPAAKQVLGSRQFFSGSGFLGRSSLRPPNFWSDARRPLFFALKFWDILFCLHFPNWVRCRHHTWVSCWPHLLTHRHWSCPANSWSDWPAVLVQCCSQVLLHSWSAQSSGTF